MTRLQILTGGNKKIVDFHASKPAYTAPEIVESYVDDDGEVNHILSNGRTTLDTAYRAMWGKPKGVINLDKKYKGENPDKRKIWMK